MDRDIPALTSHHLLRRYYRNQTVQRRMVEFLGGASLRDSTAAFIVANDGCEASTPPSPARFLPIYLNAGYEVERSLWDRNRLIADLDIDYENFDSGIEPYRDPQHVFALMQPVLNVCMELLADDGIHPLHLISGRGHHLLWTIPKESAAFHRLAELGDVPASLAATYARPLPPSRRKIEPELGCAFDGLGKLIEFLSHRIIALAAPGFPLPIELTLVDVGGAPGARRSVSLDLSEYGDPLHVRRVRIPFSAYLKPRRFEWAFTEQELESILPIFEIPSAGMKVEELLGVMRDPALTIQLARRTSTKIPDAAAGTSRLIAAYERSDLAAFHAWFAGGNGHPTYDQACREALPPCARFVLDNPNDLLLKPGFHQFIVRTLLGLGWHPQAIAQLIAGRFHEDHHWGACWRQHNPEYRAQFYTRLFAGMVATGLDSLIDLNCVSHQEKHYCMTSPCSGNLLFYQQSTLNRRQNERLGCGPFNRLLLADEHL